jgi:hypothetical protein
MNIVINPSASLSANPAALAAFHRAATHWESLLSDPITVTVNGNLAPSSGFVAQTSPVTVGFNYDVIRNAMVADAADEAPDDAIVASLPTAATFTATVPAGASLNGGMFATKANLKAIGVNVDDVFGPNDANITFNSNVSFDYDSSNGINPNQRDFESAALHEIGHALGFISMVETLSSSVSPTPLDLFRFQNGAANVDPTTATFATTPRSLVTGGVPIFDDGVNEWAMSSQTDGYGASHWKDDSLTGIYIGLMDPAGVNGQAKYITIADLRAFDLIGYELTTVPEPAGLVGLTSGALGIRRRRSKRPTSASAGPAHHGGPSPATVPVGPRLHGDNTPSLAAATRPSDRAGRCGPAIARASTLACRRTTPPGSRRGGRCYF